MNNIYNKIIERVNGLDPVKYSSNRNFINGNVSKLSPYISRGVISTKTIFNQLIKSGYEISQIQKFLQELSWRDYWQKKWQTLVNIDHDLKNKQSPVLSNNFPQKILNYNSSISAIDKGVKELYETGYMHNHLRMYTAAICCNIGQYNWLNPAKWMYYHLLDGDWGSNALSWQWVAGTNSHKKYIANQENINKYCFTKDESTFLDKTYEELSKYETVPKELSKELNLEIKCNLPKAEKIEINEDIPTIIYTSYNLDSNWKKNMSANRILLIEPSHFDKYPVSKKVMDFIVLISNEINNIQIAVMEFSDLYKIINNKEEIYYKEHPFSNHFMGIKEQRDWMFPEIEASGSFFTYWKKGIKSYHQK